MSSEKELQSDINKTRVLIVEDEVLQGLYLKEILEQKNYNVIASVDTGIEAIENAEKLRPHIILMDIILKGDLDGIDAAARIQTELDIPVIFLTASVDEYNLNRAKKTEPYGYLIKPVQVFELYSTIETALSKYRYEQKIKDSEEFSRSLLINSPHPILVVNPDTSIRYINPAMEELTGYSHIETEGMKIPYPWWCDNTIWNSEQIFINELAENRGKVEEIYRKKNNEYLRVELKAIPVIKGNNTEYYLYNIVDLTIRKKLEEEILYISEKERIRIGQDLHDGIGQDMTGISYLFRVLTGKLEKKEFPDKEEIARLSELIDGTKESIRMISKGLSPVNMRSDGIQYALAELCNNMETIYDISCTFDFDENIAFRDNSVATHIFYIVLESMSNAVKHGASENISVSLVRTGDGIEIMVRDDGKGFAEGDLSGKGIGLALMKYRADIIGGILNISRNEPSGTLITCSIDESGRMKNHAG
jgi:PAS domain S-box-containing protein